MTPRAIRRAQERRRQKEANKQAKFAPQQVSQESQPPRWTDASPAEIRALLNRANAQRSTSPKSETDRAESSLNARPEKGTALGEKARARTTLTGRAVLVPADDSETYQNHLLAYKHELHPVGPRETALVQSLADTDWRLERIAALEMAIYARGRSEFAEQFEHEDAALRPALIELETFLKYEKQLRNLQLQETRLRRQGEKDMAELRHLQKERSCCEPEQDETVAPKDVPGRNSAKLGFEFSTEPAHDENAAEILETHAGYHGSTSAPAALAA